MSTSSLTATHNIRTLPLLRASQGMASSLSACSVKRSPSLYSTVRQAPRSVFSPAIGLLAMTLLDLEALDEIALGATVLGTGGGGDPTLGKLMAQQAVARHGPIHLLPLDEVPDEEWIIPTAMMGAPTVLVEKIPSGTEVLDAFRMLERRLHCRAVATLSIEAGGVNSMIPMVVAASLGLPIVDADGMGRAFPEIQMVTPTLYGVSATPMALADEKANAAIIETIDNRWTERLARSLTIDMGCTAMIALYGMDGRMLKEAMVPGTIGLAEELGRLVRETRAAHGDAIGAVVERLGGFRAFTRRIPRGARRPEPGFARGERGIEGAGREGGPT